MLNALRREMIALLCLGEKLKKIKRETKTNAFQNAI